MFALSISRAVGCSALFPKKDGVTAVSRNETVEAADLVFLRVLRNCDRRHQGRQRQARRAKITRASLPVLRRSHAHHRDLSAGTTAQAPPDAGPAGDQDRHLMTPGTAARYRNCLQRSCRLGRQRWRLPRNVQLFRNHNPKTPNLIAEHAHSARPPLFPSPSQWSSIRDDDSP